MTTEFLLPSTIQAHVKIVDNYYADPSAVRDLAVATSFHDFGERANFPGRESDRAFYTRSHVERFEGAVGEPISYDPKRWVFGKFRSATSDDGYKAQVHIDRVDWTAVIYLSQQERGGDLGFYSHRELNIDTVPEFFPSFGCATLDEFDRRYIVAQSGRDEDWELIGTIPIRFNRCIIFRGARLFHAITSTFGRRVEDSRLTQNFFFNSSSVGETCVH
jgi:hypothetical protein